MKDTLLAGRVCWLGPSGRENANNRKMGVGQSQVDLVCGGGGARQ